MAISHEISLEEKLSQFHLHGRNNRPDHELLATIPALGSSKESRLLFEKPRAQSFLDSILNLFKRPIQQGLAKKQVEEMLKVAKTNTSLSDIGSVKALQQQLKKASPFSGVGSHATQSAIIDMAIHGAALSQKFTPVFEGYLEGLRNHYQELSKSKAAAISHENAKNALDILIRFAKQPDCPVSKQEQVIVNKFYTELGDVHTSSKNTSAHCGMAYDDALDEIIGRYSDAFKNQSRIVELQEHKLETPSQQAKNAALRESSLKELRSLAREDRPSSMANLAINSFEEFIKQSQPQIATETQKESLSNFLNFHLIWLPKLTKDAQAFFLPKIISLEDALAGNKPLESFDPSSLDIDAESKRMVSELRGRGLAANGLSPTVVNALIHYILIRKEITKLENEIENGATVVSEIEEKRSELLTSQNLERRLTSAPLKIQTNKKQNSTELKRRNFSQSEAKSSKNLISIKLPTKDQSDKANKLRKVKPKKAQQRNEYKKNQTFSELRKINSSEKILGKKKEKLIDLKNQAIGPANVHLLDFAAKNSSSLLQCFTVLDKDDAGEIKLLEIMKQTIGALHADLDEYSKKIEKAENAALEKSIQERQRNLDALRTVFPKTSSASGDEIRAFEDFVVHGTLPSPDLHAQFLGDYYLIRHKLDPDIQQSLHPSIVDFEEAMFDKESFTGLTLKDFRVTSRNHGRLVNSIIFLMKNFPGLPKSVGYRILDYIEMKERIFHLENALNDSSASQSQLIMAEFKGNRDWIKAEINSIKQRLVDQQSVELLSEYKLYERAMMKRTLDNDSGVIIQRFFNDLAKDLADYPFKQVNALKSELPSFPEDALQAVREFLGSDQATSPELLRKFLSHFYQDRRLLSVELKTLLMPTILAVEEAVFDQSDLADMAIGKIGIIGEANQKLAEGIHGLLNENPSLPKSVGYQLLRYIELKENILQLEYAIRNPGKDDSKLILQKFKIKPEQIQAEIASMKKWLVMQESFVLLNEHTLFETALMARIKNEGDVDIVKRFFDGLRRDLTGYEKQISKPASVAALSVS